MLVPAVVEPRAVGVASEKSATKVVPDVARPEPTLRLNVLAA